MRIELIGTTQTKSFPSIRYGCVSEVLPREIKVNKSMLYGREITFRCNAHDISNTGNQFTINLSVSDETDIDPTHITALYLSTHSKKAESAEFDFTLQRAMIYTKDGRSFDVTQETSFMDKDISKQIGEKNISYPSFRKIKQMLVKGQGNMKEELNEIVNNSEATSLEVITEAYQAEQAKSEEYAKDM